MLDYIIFIIVMGCILGLTILILVVWQIMKTVKREQREQTPDRHDTTQKTRSTQKFGSNGNNDIEHVGYPSPNNLKSQQNTTSTHNESFLTVIIDALGRIFSSRNPHQNYTTGRKNNNNNE